ncbi:DUF4405 domain-containing protein [Thermococcus celericrescens]|nr:DUF4405 domain-containing protein [Thermococcus celericrescens]
MNMGYGLRMWVSPVLFVLWLVTGITGVILLVAPLAAELGVTLPVSLADTLHIYLGFAFFGLSFVHIALNWSAMRAYFRRLRG